jgi:hypothetical protein
MGSMTRLALQAVDLVVGVAQHAGVGLTVAGTDLVHLVSSTIAGVGAAGWRSPLGQRPVWSLP